MSDFSQSLIVITAPSGAGKTALITKYISEHPESGFSVSHTTRSPRPGEVNGINYHFISKDKFLKMKDQGDFLEFAEVHGNCYGTSKKEIQRLEKEGKKAILDIDVQGGLTLMEMGIQALYIFISVPSWEVLKERLEGRGTENPESLEIRLGNARRELEYAKDWKHVIINANFDRAYEELSALISSMGTDQET